MLESFLISPHPVLSDCVNNYSLCKFESIDRCLAFPWLAHPDTSLAFFFGDTPIQIINANSTDETKSTSKICLFGALTHCNGIMTFEGKFNTFVIEFKPNGFNKLFRVPACEICNTTLPANEVIGNGVSHLYEQMLYALNLPEMAYFADKFLIDLLNQQKSMVTNDGITRISNQLLTTLHANVTQYAFQANMSMRNFERRFMEQVGTSPKLFCRLLRFQATINCKMVNPKKSWAEIAYECGYFDSMHMIKDFKQFANASPAAVFSGNPWFMEQSSTTIERAAL
ncbi:MAG: AraC family transcriptional regulator [Chitinophagaceae bacterium]